ncbi:DUF1566 domain-containing protein [Actinoplanes sp. CA-015351]|uniref:Lcl domain-containing protein n=1 Tax=Actinoplanes sp. CA-015351 TaxID=3239897 RepID=UPI003D968440
MSRIGDLVAAAQSGDRRAREEFARAYLPLVYNVVGRALGGHPDFEDVVQETMLLVLRDLPALRQPQSVRAWVLAIAMHQIGVHRQRAESAAAHMAVVPAVPGRASSDFEELAILRLRLTGERRQVAEASRWLDDEDRVVLALWWQEAAGELSRAEVAGALETTVAYAAVRIQRMRGQLDRSRALVAALESRPRCAELEAVVAAWDGQPSPLWRKRIDRHVRDCRMCAGRSAGEVAVERLLVGCALLPVPAAVTAAVGAATPKSTGSTPAFVGIAATALVAVVVGTYAYVSKPERPEPAAQSAVVAPSVSVVDSPSASKKIAPSKIEKPSASPTPTAPTALASRWASWPVPGPARKASYKNLGNGTVRDNVTGLEWQREAAAKTYTFTQAKSYCDGLGTDGGGWHLPTRIELTSIVDHSRSAPAIDTKAFPGTPAQFFWTATPWAVTKTPLRAWIINFYEGLASNGAFQDGSFQVRCVRSVTGTGKPAYQISGGQVTDPQTGLIWRRATSKEMSATEATAFCDGLGDGWRLPTVRELSTTVDDSRVAPAISTKAFPDTPKFGWYWTSDKADPEPGKRWALNYDDGYTNYRKIESGFARCVRQ